MSPQQNFSLVFPFPLASLAECYEWHKYTTTVVNGRTLSQADFMAYMLGFLREANCMSWGIVDSVGKCVGMVLADPIYRGWELVDANVHIALARSAWGKGAIDCAAQEIIPALFNGCPSLTRLSGVTPSYYRPGLAVAKRLGFSVEGVLRDAVHIDGRLCSLTLTGLTRSEWNAGKG